MAGGRQLMDHQKTVYIPSRGRPGNVLRTLPRWLGQGYAVRYVIEPRDYRAYQSKVDQVWARSSFDAIRSTKRPQLVLLPDSDRGIGFARDFCLAQALIEDLPTFVLSDDDVMPLVSNSPVGLDQFTRLHNAVTELSLFACSAVHSYQDFLTRGWLKKERQYENGAWNGRPFLATTGSWHTCYAINAKLAIDLGGFDSRFNVAYEDNDLHMRALLGGNSDLGFKSVRSGHIWAAHSGVWMDYIGKRFAPGGLADYAGIDDEGENTDGSEGASWYDKEHLRCRTLIHELYPDFVSAPPKRVMFKWSKMLESALGDNWKDLSAIHGGNLPDVQDL